MVSQLSTHSPRRAGVDCTQTTRAHKGVHNIARRRGFSLIEMMVALVITATLFAATMSALDASFKSYRVTSDSASTHVVTRIVMQRLTALIRTGDTFWPYPVNPRTQPIITSDRLSFVSYRDPATGTERITTLFIQPAADENGPFQLWYTVTTMVDGDWTSETTRPLLDGVEQLTFTLEYDVGPRLRRATIDLVVQPDDLQDAAITAGLESPRVRLVASASPRRLD